MQHVAISNEPVIVAISNEPVIVAISNEPVIVADTSFKVASLEVAEETGAK